MYSKQSLPKYKPRQVLYMGVTLPLWSSALVATLILASLLYGLLTHQIPL
jgi:ABC-type spermidine/putrescine transport system permease subunit I